MRVQPDLDGGGGVGLHGVSSILGIDSRIIRPSTRCRPGFRGSNGVKRG
ncbi:hypothetical protein ISF6_3854 [Piscinibacter sakaiensis]|uniref:Uncharacterized protein n=1 Tax=Piscinibacter sakaiensis TaxID=1547922 RepID=A0A0K8NVW2_PISS1|nr:hypothetical protein ISF6_3854 [Piscinibacter sakaiensis]